MSQFDGLILRTFLLFLTQSFVRFNVFIFQKNKTLAHVLQEIN